MKLFNDFTKAMLNAIAGTLSFCAILASFLAVLGIIPSFGLVGLSSTLKLPAVLGAIVFIFVSMVVGIHGTSERSSIGSKFCGILILLVLLAVSYALGLSIVPDGVFWYWIACVGILIVIAFVLVIFVLYALYEWLEGCYHSFLFRNDAKALLKKRVVVILGSTIGIFSAFAAVYALFYFWPS